MKDDEEYGVICCMGMILVPGEVIDALRANEVG